jgi:hypothetical protein
MRNMGVADFLGNPMASQTPPAFPCRKAQILSYPALRNRPSE